MDHRPRPQRRSLPRWTEPAHRGGIPVFATLAPVLAAVVLWAVTGSVYSLLFAALGPVVAIASGADRAIGSRRLRRRETDRVIAAIERAGEAARLDLDSERGRLDELVERRRLPFPSIHAHGASGDPLGVIPVRIGRGTLPSSLTWDGGDGADPVPDRVAAAIDDLARRTAVVTDAPICIDAAGGVGVVGPAVLAASVARTVLLAVAAALPPDSTVIRIDPTETWAARLPHRVLPGPDGRADIDCAGGRLVVIWGFVDGAERLPVVVRVTGASPVEILEGPSPLPVSSVRLDLIPAAAAASIAGEIRSAAGGSGLAVPASDPPELVRFVDLPIGSPPQSSVPGSSDPPSLDSLGLAAPIGLDGDGPVWVDLVADGPHAVVGGTTGSGKSELLVGWILAMAERRQPTEVAFLLIDFKGGASFAPVVDLPHVVGVLSDLDPALVLRAVGSLRAEILRRERRLAEAGRRSVDDLRGTGTRMGRLVIVIDEFAALMSEQPELHGLIADLAARGRSLGLHLVLCTQRPAGIVRDAVLANAGLRISLRVNNAADSRAVIGADDAAAVPVERRGRAILSRGDGRLRVFQAALADENDAVRVAASAGACVPERPWAEPLPARVSASELVDTPGTATPSGEVTVFGLADLPEEQRLGRAEWDPRRDGHLVVLGSSRRGRTTALAALATGRDRSLTVPSEPADAWGSLQRFVADRSASPGGAALIVDDLDLLLERVDDDTRPGLVQLLVRAARRAADSGGALLVSASRVPPGCSALMSLIGCRLLLALPSREDHVVAGGVAADWRPDRRAGSAVWRGREVQIASGFRLPRPIRPDVPLVDPGVRPSHAIVTTRPDAVTDRLASAGVHALDVDGIALPDLELVMRGGAAAADRSVVIGEPDAWQARWDVLEAARRGPMLLDRCTASDVRTLTRLRTVPPPLDDAVDAEAWRCTGRRIDRVRIRWGATGGGVRPSEESLSTDSRVADQSGC